jgi:hypothetical protein
MTTIAQAFARAPRVRLSVPQGQRVGFCPRCHEAIVFERWRDYWRSNVASEYGRLLSTGAYDVLEDHECLDVTGRGNGTHRRGRTS